MVFGYIILYLSLGMVLGYVPAHFLPYMPRVHPLVLYKESKYEQKIRIMLIKVVIMFIL